MSTSLSATASAPRRRPEFLSEASLRKSFSLLGQYPELRPARHLKECVVFLWSWRFEEFSAKAQLTVSVLRELRGTRSAIFGAAQEYSPTVKNT